MPTTDNAEYEVPLRVMRSALSVMAKFKADFEPSGTALPRTERPQSALSAMAESVPEILADSAVQAWMNRTIDSWPGEMFSVFVRASGIIGQILGTFGVRATNGIGELAMSAVADPEMLQMMMALVQVARETDALKDKRGNGDSMGIQQALHSEMLRRDMASRTPFARTLTTMLGQDALLWLTAESRDGMGKIQPHEFSRTGWTRLWDIENQLAIEQELAAIPQEAAHLAKSVVALSWTLAALASFMEPAIFFGEQASHLVSVRGGQYTVGSGTGSHTLMSFQSAVMPAAVEILYKALTNPLFSAADLMWIGAALAQVREIVVRHVGPAQIVADGYDMFLSHRGCDSKLPLSELLQTLPQSHGVFLDCMNLPRGVINRSFVYGSLARSKHVVVVDSAHFEDSDWCRKEAWLADAMAQQGLLKCSKMALGEAQSLVAEAGPASRRRRADAALGYEIGGRILKDIDYWARVPNLHSLREKGLTTDVLSPLSDILLDGPKLESLTWVQSVADAVRGTLTTVLAQNPEGEPIDLWATALQYSVAAFGAGSMARSKDEVRRGIDQLNAATRALVAAEMHRAPEFVARGPAYLALLAAAVATQLAGYNLDSRMAPAVQKAVLGAGTMTDGLLLLDARERGTSREFRLLFAVELMRGNIGSIGIVQDASDEVHQAVVNDVPLDILPCITLHKGMRAPAGLG